MFVEYEPGEKHGKKNADTAETADSFQDAGYLLEKNEVVIDIDSLSKDQLCEFIKRFNVQTQIVWTERGAHLYYRKPLAFGRGKNSPCALGFEIETKTSTSAPGGVTVKRNGVMRKIDNPGAREELPWYFTSRKQFVSLVGMGEGGRNNALFSHKQKLDNHPDTEKICRFVNEVLFDEPLSEDEFSTVIRTYSSTPSTEGEYALADNVMNEFRCVVFQGLVYFWNGIEYVTDTDDYRLMKFIWERCPGKRSNYIEEVIKQIRNRGRRQTDSNLPIVFNNGFLDSENGEFVEFKGFSEFSPYHINADYNPSAVPVQAVDDYIDQLTGSDPDYKKLLLEIMAYPMITDPERMKAIGKFFMLRGNGANGKSTLLNIMRRIYNPRNCSAVSLKQLPDSRFNVSLLGKLCNLGDDIQPDAITNDEMKMLKNIATADTIETRLLYKHSFLTTITTKLYFSANTDIKSFEKGYAYQRRVMWVPMFNTVEKPDPRFLSKMTSPEALAYWIRLLVDGYTRIYHNPGFSPCEKVERYNAAYHMENNYMALFADEIGDVAILGKTPTDVKWEYERWNDDDTRRYNPKLLNDYLRSKGIGLGKKKVGGDSRRRYMRQTDTEQDLFGVR